MAATQRPSTSARRPFGRELAPCRRAPQSPRARPAHRLASRKLAPGFFRSDPAPHARRAAAQAADECPACTIFSYQTTSGYTVAPNRVANSNWLQNAVDWFFGPGSSLPRYMMGTPFGTVVNSLDNSTQSYAKGDNVDGTLYGLVAAGAVASTVLVVEPAVGAEGSAPGEVPTVPTVVSNPGPNGFVLIGDGSLESATVVRQGEYVNRVYDSNYGDTPGASGPMGGSFSPGSGVPTTATEAIADRGLSYANQNNAQQAVVYQATGNIPATQTTSLGGTAPEIQISQQNQSLLTPVAQFPVVK
jgi:hypothetical protein